MSDDKEEKKEKEPAKKGGSKIGMIIIAVFVCISATFGAAFGQVALAKMKPEPKEKPDAAYEETEKEAPIAESISLEALIIDVRNDSGEVHHLKIGIAVELAKKVPEEEQKPLVIRAKDAAISYLRTLSYDEVTNQDKFEGIKKELHERIAKAMGHGRVASVLFTEYVVQ